MNRTGSEPEKQAKFSAPKVEQRDDLYYVGLRTKARMDEMSRVIPQSHDEVYAWLEGQGIQPAGAPLVRYHVIDMERELDIEMGVPVTAVDAARADALTGDRTGGRINVGVLPAGRYAALVYTGLENGIAGNAVLLDWGVAQGLVWDRWDPDSGGAAQPSGADAFGGRYETFLTEPDDEPDTSKWETEVAIRLRED